MHTTAFTGIAVAASLLAGTAAHHQGADPDTHARIDDYLQARLEATDVPGASWAVVTPDEIEHVVAWGEDGDGEPVTESTPFLWGSVAKPVTATAVMTLVEDGAIDLDEPVTAYLPGFRLADEDHSDRITVRHLLQQTGGIPEGTGITDRFEDRADPYGDAVADLAGVRPLAGPGEAFGYASANYLVLGAVVESASGMPYAEYLREAVLDPLDMDGAVATREDAAAVPDGHSYAFGRPVGIDVSFDQTGPSYGYLGGSVTDLAHFGMAQLGEGVFGETRVLEPSSVAETHTGAAPMNETVSYGLGWRVDDRNADLGTSTVWHTGAAPGYLAGVILLPEIDRAVVMVQNLYGFFQDGALVGAMLNAARVLAGGEAAVPASDPTYPAILAVLLALLSAAALVLVWTLRRIRRGGWRSAPRRRVAAGMACWTIGGLAVAYAAGVAVPGLFPNRSLLVLLLPDMGWSLYALALAALLVAAVRLWAGFRRLAASR
ncbi:beta-lactamase family protein [Glycomyces sp. L485]|uniref:serine hydrolase domain-containing protein n=1 Tax=Glycomyces sp. L485 TaxID=2909235 RepID=UPI001F4ABCF0|nr:beta-lactamase family protein [Glycomyces sp. L485]MCH7230346.1 beta-lactamase family protein [Glycomyces sp. L485]